MKYANFGFEVNIDYAGKDDETRNTDDYICDQLDHLLSTLRPVKKDLVRITIEVPPEDRTSMTKPRKTD